jgi:hypothetical protein
MDYFLTSAFNYLQDVQAARCTATVGNAWAHAAHFQVYGLGIRGTPASLVGQVVRSPEYVQNCADMHTAQ